MKLRIEPASRPLRGTLRPPGDKSISHRAAIFGGLATGTTRIEGFLVAEDTLATLGAMAALGARVRRDAGQVEIQGGRLHAPDRALDMGNSGTGMRLLTGALAGHPDLFGTTLELIGDASLSRRPMRRIIEPLAAMGAQIDSSDGHAPLRVRPVLLKGRTHQLSIASAQVKSAILLAGLQAEGTTTITEPGPSRDHTERLVPAFGVDIDCGDQRVMLHGPQRLTACRVSVPGDPSSAAFMIAAAALVPGSSIEIMQVGVNPTRNGFFRVLEKMSSPSILRLQAQTANAGAEPVASICVTGPSGLKGVEIPEQWVPLAIDEFPLIMAMAATAGGVTTITGAAELRVKESDRLAVMSRQLQRLGVRVDETADGAVVYGGRVDGGEVDAEGDHRIAMSLAVLGLAANGPVVINGAQWIQTSYPGFVDDLNLLGAEARWI
ncbi:MAG: 3-phosphoshikimate 1-carboxyvinyltransferase [Wenzhouxiangellaceae bacterium]|nr:3-phosphoshikimate 1-carboxyvinyltransferase [Wenzhouxiangellaceae bacterium]